MKSTRTNLDIAVRDFSSNPNSLLLLCDTCHIDYDYTVLKLNWSDFAQTRPEYYKDTEILKRNMLSQNRYLPDIEKIKSDYTKDIRGEIKEYYGI